MNSEKVNIALRCYIEGKERGEGKSSFDKNYNHNLTLVLDTETVIAKNQSLLFGSCYIYENNELNRKVIFYPKNLTTSQLAILKESAEQNKTELMNLEEFIRLFFTYVYKRRALCIGFNLPFDLSRLAILINTSKRDKDSFSLKLSDKTYDPHIVIKHISSKSSFIGFTRPAFMNKKRMNKYAGAFLDLRTLAFALTNKGFTLEKACEEFGVENPKIKTEYGKITLQHVFYNLRDVLATYELYIKLAEKFKGYSLSVQINTLFSPASLGKAYLEAMNIKSFSEQNPSFSKNMLGYIMTTYFGGRAEVHIRKKPTPVSYLDFTSMYPSQFELQDLWPFVIAEKINVIEDNEFTEFIEKVTLSDLRNKETFRKLRGIALVRAEEDIFPIRAKYGNKKTFNIGTNYVKGELYYTYADIIASKLLTGKTPKILKAYKFEPVGVQRNLKPITLFGKTIDPCKESFIKALIEHRLEVKDRLKIDKNNEDLRNQEHVAKIIANTISYGIYIEINTIPIEEGEDEEVKDVYGLRHLKITVGKDEQQGKAFNPLVATFLTSGARLVLAMAEKYLKDNNGYYAYCDTDGIFVNPESVKGLQELVKPLNPYNKALDMFKIEDIEDENKNKITLDNVIFYGISAKRYCLYVLDNATNQINVLKYSSSALGQVSSMPKGWERKFWMDILRYHEGKITREEIENKYKNVPVATQLSITSPRILKRFKDYNKLYAKDRINAFNFVMIGIGYRLDDVTGEPIIPLIPFTKNTSEIRHTPFVDYKTGKVYTENTQFYWKPLSELFFEYIDNKEQKYINDNVTLERRHLIVDNIIYIGKESNNLEEAEVIGVQDGDYVIYDDKITGKIMELIKNLDLKEALKEGMSRREFYYLKNKVKSKEELVLKGKTLKILKRLMV